MEKRIGVFLEQQAALLRVVVVGVKRRDEDGESKVDEELEVTLAGSGLKLSSADKNAEFVAYQFCFFSLLVKAAGVVEEMERGC